jgi:hypothetical protein
MDSAALALLSLSGENAMIGGQQVPDNDFDDDGAGRLALIGVLIVLAVMVAGFVLTMKV